MKNIRQFNISFVKW